MAAEQRNAVAWAAGRFSQIGLQLPAISVRFDASRDLCGGAEGLHHYGGSSHQVTVCTLDRQTFYADLQRRRTLLHEFAHAWETVELTEDDRNELNELFGTVVWADPQTAWADRGAEQFAETMVFGLLDQPRRELKIHRECAELLAHFM